MKIYICLLSFTLTLVGAGCVSKNNDVVNNTAPEIEFDYSTTESVTTQKIEQQQASDYENGIPVVDVVLGGKPDAVIQMETGNFFFKPNEIKVSTGDRIKITFTKNTGMHTFVIDELGVDYSIAEGESYTFNAPTETGRYAYYCDIGSNRSFGMEGTLIVE